MYQYVSVCAFLTVLASPGALLLHVGVSEWVFLKTSTIGESADLMHDLNTVKNTFEEQHFKRRTRLQRKDWRKSIRNSLIGGPAMIRAACTLSSVIFVRVVNAFRFP